MKNAIGLLLLIMSFAGYGQPHIKFNKEKYQQGDTINIHTDVPELKKDSIHFSSLYLLIENIKTQKRWTYRYPIVDGINETNIIIDSAMPDGNYAFSFLVRKQFFSLQASVEDGEQQELSFTMLTKQQDSYVEKRMTDNNGSLTLRGLLFEDTCYFIFSPVKKQAGLKMDIVTPLDSAFESDLKYTQIISLGNAPVMAEKEKNYKADPGAFTAQVTLPDVLVSTSRKKKIDRFNEEFSTGLFRNSNGRMFDGLEDNKMAQSTSIMEFLKGRVPGLQIFRSGDNYTLQWRGQTNFRGGSNVDVFLDEFIVNPVTDFFISPTSIAMIKTYPPPAFLSPGGQRGAIAIYTKHGGYDNDNLFRNNFKVFGYSSPESVWK